MGIELGIAQVDITPEVGLPLMGNYRSDYAARGVHDPLYAKAVVFRDAEGTAVALLTLDLCMVDRHNADLIRRTIAARSDIRAEHVLVHATHTHSGPAVTGRLGMAALVAPHRARIDALLQSAAMAVVAARDNMAAATLTIGDAEQHDISFNRRLQRKTGGTQMNWETLQAGFDVEQIEGSFGPIDPQLVCMGFERDERSFGTLVCFGLHPAILAGDHWEYSADYPAQLAAALALEIKRRSPAASTLVLGLCNDAIGYLPTRAAFAQGGYETLPGSTFYQPGAAERLMDAALRLLAAQWRS